MATMMSRWVIGYPVVELPGSRRTGEFFTACGEPDHRQQDRLLYPLPGEPAARSRRHGAVTVWAG
jgi:hypothetical protein